MKTSASIWISDENGEYWAEGVKATVEVEVTDVDEVRMGISLGGESSDVASIYLSRSAADNLARFLAAASVDEVRVFV